MRRTGLIGVVFVSVLAALAGPAFAAEPKIDYRVPPSYPDDAAAAKIEGEVEASVTLTAGGRVKAVTILSETPTGQGFAESASQALMLWQFEPGEAGRQVHVTIPFRHPQPYTLAEMAAMPPAEPLRPATPRYPHLARIGGQDGLVELILGIDPEGHVERVQVMTERPTDRNFAFVTLAALDDAAFPQGRPGVYRYRQTFDIRTAQPDAPIDPSEAIGTLREHYITSSTSAPGFPDAARKAKKGGAVDLLVRINKRGVVTAVQIRREEPAGFGFGDAAIHAAEQIVAEGFAPGVHSVAVTFRFGTGR